MTAAALNPQRVLVTGAAGFIGSHVAHALLDRGVEVIGLDNLNAYYPVALKRDRLARLEPRAGFTFVTADIADYEGLRALKPLEGVDLVIHLAAQVGVRYSIENPFAYAAANLTGHLSMLEWVRRAPNKPRMIYASSSSVYGANAKAPYAETDRVDEPMSLYAATKRADELLSESYARLYGLSQVGLRFFTVYGPWGRPDMAYWTFTRNIIEKKPIRVFNHGDLMRDFTFVDDIVQGIASIALKPAPEGAALHRIYNIGNNKPEPLMQFIAILEEAIGSKAEKIFEPMQPGDVYATAADISAIARDYGFAPTTSLEQGLPRFVAWYRGYSGPKA